MIDAMLSRTNIEICSRIMCSLFFLRELKISKLKVVVKIESSNIMVA